MTRKKVTLESLLSRKVVRKRSARRLYQKLMYRYAAEQQKQKQRAAEQEVTE